MVNVLVTGAAGFLGQTVVEALIRRERLSGPRGVEPITSLTLVDRVPAVAPDGPFERQVVDGSLVDADLSAMMADMDVIIHLAAFLTIESERDVRAGYDLNLQVPLRMLEAARLADRRPRMVFPSSIAVFGGKLPDRVTENTVCTPRTSYGTAKAMVELMISDYARHGFVDGRAIRIPIVMTRPGLPSPVVSDIVGEVVRGPLLGRNVLCPLDPDAPFPIVSVERVAENIVNLVERPADRFGVSRAVHQPGLTTTPRQLVESLERLVGDKAKGRVTFEPDAAVTKVVAGWPSDFASEIEDPLAGDADVDSIVRLAANRFA